MWSSFYCQYSEFYYNPEVVTVRVPSRDQMVVAGRVPSMDQIDLLTIIHIQLDRVKKFKKRLLKNVNRCVQRILFPNL